MKPNWRKSGIALLGTCAMVGSYVAGRARADGIPNAPMVYSGFLEDSSGNPVNGTKDITVALFPSQSSGSAVCSTGSSPTAVAKGRFQVVLPDACTVAAKQNPELWVELTIAGNGMPRSRLGVVPFAIEAGRASSAAGALDTRIHSLETGTLKTADTLVVKTGDLQFTECQEWLKGTGAPYSIFNCVVMARNKCAQAGYKTGWFPWDGSATSTEFKVDCIK